MKFKIKALTAVAFACAAGLSWADLTVGVTLSTTGPAASLGIPQKNTIALMPHTIAGEKINYIVLDDASDTTQGVTNTRKLISENNVDIILGSSTTPVSLAMIDIVAEAKTPMISVAASAKIVEPVDAKRHWVFKTPQNDIMMSLAIVEHMANNGVKTVGFIGFSDAYGEGWAQEFAKAAALKKINIVASERYARTDTSVTGQALKIKAANPDAVLIAGSGTPAALPQTALKKIGYAGKYYQTHGVANNDFLRVGGKDVEGTILPAGPVLVADQLPATNQVKASALAYVHAYEKAYGKGSVSTFGAHGWDAGVLMTAAVPVALKKAKPGTPEFRVALHNAIVNTKELVGTHGVYNFKSGDLYGVDKRARVIVKLDKGGKWTLMP